MKVISDHLAHEFSALTYDPCYPENRMGAVNTDRSYLERSLGTPEGVDWVSFTLQHLVLS